jgi:hypothetical protein
VPEQSSSSRRPCTACLLAHNGIRLFIRPHLGPSYPRPPSVSTGASPQTQHAPMSSLVKIPLVIVAAFGTWYALTPPQPPPGAQERVKSDGVERSFGCVVRIHALVWKVRPALCGPSTRIPDSTTHPRTYSVLSLRVSLQSSSLVFSPSRCHHRLSTSPSSASQRHLYRCSRQCLRHCPLRLCLDAW